MAPERLLFCLWICTLSAEALATADVTVVQMPASFIADGASTSAVYCSIIRGYPNNVYAVKGTFSNGDLPYYGLTYVPATTMWAGQIQAWDTSQMRVQTDARGEWRGWMYVRLESTAPHGDILFRCAAIPLSPVSNPGPTVSDWNEARSEAAPDAGFLTGHVYLDPACTQPAERIVVCAMDTAGRIVAAYLSQNSRVADGEDHLNAGGFRLGVPRGTIASISGRSLANQCVALYTRSRGPWSIAAGSATSVDTLPWGDVDGDGSCTLADAACALRISSGILWPPSGWLTRADVEPDGSVTIADAAAIARRCLP